jgi:uncharacterized membrane-anchored protein
MRSLRRSRQPKTVILAVSVFSVIIAMSTVYAALGDQTIVKDSVAAPGWTLIVPMSVDGNQLTDYLSYNAATGRAIVSIGIGDGGEQTIVKDYVAAKGWTLIVPMNIDGDSLTDLLSYNRTTGRAIMSIGIGNAGEQKIVKDYVAASGWTSIVPLNVDAREPDDLLSYNGRTGRTIVSVGVGFSGEQTIVKDYAASPGWTSIVPMNIDSDPQGRTDFLSYNATTGRAVVSIGVGNSGEQKILKDYSAASGWTSIVPMNVDCDSGDRTDYLSYNAGTGRAIVSAGVGDSGDQRIVKEYTSATRWTAIVPMNVDGKDLVTDLLSYNAQTGRAIVSVGESCHGRT